MKVHHLNCGTMMPLGGRFLYQKNAPSYFVTHCLAIESDHDGIILIDSGLGLDQVVNPKSNLTPFFRYFLRPTLLKAETMLYQLEAKGFSANDVRHIVLTHLDIDHAGGLPDFPFATVHLAKEEYDASIKKSYKHALRYHQHLLSHRPDFSFGEPYEGEFFGLKNIRRASGLKKNILMVPLSGHSRGHQGIAFESDGRWLFHAGDAYFHRKEIDPTFGEMLFIIDKFQTVLEIDSDMRRGTQIMLAELNKNENLEIFSTHDAVEYQKLAKEV